jgi:hypothetical protein
VTSLCHVLGASTVKKISTLPSYKYASGCGSKIVTSRSLEPAASTGLDAAFEET